jgi:chromatin segregation and condensation protein Rec8/ScpA/Scc1 (kleisin family)
VLTKSITLDDLVTKVTSRIGIKGRAIKFPFAEPCMDVDKPHQLEMLREDLVKQQRKSAAKARSSIKVKSPKSKSEKPAAKRSSGAKKVAAFAAARTLAKPKAKPKRP